jgi:hypothetical protein
MRVADSFLRSLGRGEDLEEKGIAEKKGATVACRIARRGSRQPYE